MTEAAAAAATASVLNYPAASSAAPAAAFALNAAAPAAAAAGADLPDAVKVWWCLRVAGRSWPFPKAQTPLWRQGSSAQNTRLRRLVTATR